MKTKLIYMVFHIIACVVFFISLTSYCVESKTLSNKDIEELKKKQNKGIPTHPSHIPPSQSPSGYGDYSPPPIPPPSGSRGVPVIRKYLPFHEWEEGYREYFQTHYRDPSLTLNPRMIVLHYSGTPNFAALWWTYIKGGMYSSGDGQKKHGHLSTHFVVDRDGAIYQLMPLNRKARGTYGVNHVAISIDIIGRNEGELLAAEHQMKVTFALVRWLMKTYNITAAGVRSHEEVAKGKELVPEYTDFADKEFPDRYPPDSRPRGPGSTYMFKLRYFLHEPR